VNQHETGARVRLVEVIAAEDKLRQVFDELYQAPRQLALLIKYAELSGFTGTKGLKEIVKNELLQRSGVSPVVFNSLVGKGVLEVYHHETGRLERQEIIPVELNPLSDYRQLACDRIVAQVHEKKFACYTREPRAGRRKFTFI
jgi:primosomal protein N' (replication factor Y)